jgi:gamma-glutamyltranspeptidase/glutathione hydrolase
MLERRWVIPLLLATAPLAAGAATPPPVGYGRGAVAADNQLASLAGVEILRRGGDAVDAACAAAFVLGVVSPAGSGIGGGGLMLIKRRAAEPVAIDFRETAPATAGRDMFRARGVARDASRVGGLAVATPGEVRGCAEAVRRFGKLPLGAVLAPAIRHAERGFAVGAHLADAVTSMQRELAGEPCLAATLLPGGRPPVVGERLRRPELARTLRAIAARGPDAFYRGPIARALVTAVRARGGILTEADLARYRPRERHPLRARYRGHVVYSMPPPSSGGVALIEALNLLERRPLAPLGHNSSAYLHLVAEALKHVFADRARHLGDDDFVKVPVATLTARWYADLLAARLGARTLAPERYGSRTPPRAPPPVDGGTSHVSVVDREGTAVALTTTINTSFGALFCARGTGVILNNEMDDFAARPGEANAFGLVQGEQNAVAAGKRPLSSMTPTIVTRSDGELALVAGASGGPTIISGTLQALLNVVDFGLDASAAVGRTRVHHQWLPDELWVESDLPRDVTEALAARGHRLRARARPFTAVQVVLVRAAKLWPASDPRKAGAPAGY